MSNYVFPATSISAERAVQEIDDWLGADGLVSVVVPEDASNADRAWAQEVASAAKVGAPIVHVPKLSQRDVVAGPMNEDWVRLVTGQGAEYLDITDAMVSLVFVSPPEVEESADVEAVAVPQDGPEASAEEPAPLDPFPSKRPSGSSSAKKPATDKPAPTRKAAAKKAAAKDVEVMPVEKAAEKLPEPPAKTAPTSVESLLRDLVVHLLDGASEDDLWRVADLLRGKGRSGD